MEMFRSNSPESSPFAFSWRRKTLGKSHNLSITPEDKNCLTCSLPSPVVLHEMDLKNPRYLAPQGSQNELLEEDFYYDKKNNLSPSHSHQSIQRPRSASLHANLTSNPAQLQVGKRKTRLSRSRPSSARFGRARSDSLSLEQEATAGTYKVDNAFAKIRSQLAQLSEEDALLQDRLDRLTLEIASMQRCVGSLRYPPAVVPTTASGLQVPGEKSWMPSNLSVSSVPLVMVSGSQSDILAITEESWEEEEEKDLESEIVQRRGGGGGGKSEHNSNYLNLVGNSAQGTYKHESLGSCGSLADSEGSLSPGRQTCCIVVVDHDKCLIPSPLKFNYEDDVFFT